MKGLITLTLLIATFLGGYHLGRTGAFGDLSGDKILQSASKLFDGLRKFAGDKNAAGQAPQAAPQPPAETPQPAQIAASATNLRQPGKDAIVLQINGKRYEVCEGRR